jgi:DNA replication protein DnaC
MPQCPKPSAKPTEKRRDANNTDDLIAQIQRHLERLGLHELKKTLDAHLSWAQERKPSHAEFLERVLGEVAGIKRERRIERRFAESEVKVKKTLEAFNFPFQSKLDRAAIENLATLRFVDTREDVLITGKSGTGKSHILQSLVLKACHKEQSVRYARCVDLVDHLYAGLADGTYEQRMSRWCRPQLLIIDDVGLGQLKRRDDEPTAAHMLFTLLDRRHMSASTGITSNIKLSAWGKYLGDATLAAAILDRLAANSIHIDIDGPSYRQYLAHKRAKEQGITLPTDEN